VVADSARATPAAENGDAGTHRGPAASRNATPGTAVRIVGNHSISTTILRGLVGTSGFPLHPGDRDVALRRVTGAYLRAGFLGASFELTRDAIDSTWTLRVHEGARARVANTLLRGVPGVDAHRLAGELDLNPGAVFRPARIEQRIDGLLREYDSQGYPFAQVWVDSVGYDRHANTVGLVVTVMLGTRRELAGVVVEGLTRTRKSIVQRLAGVEQGVPYSSRILDDVYLRLVSSRVFEQVEEPTVQLAPDGRRVRAVIRVKEAKRANRFAAALGYATAQGAGTRRVVNGLVHLDLVNIGGTLRDLEVLWSNDGRRRRETRIHFRDRFFTGRALSLGVRLEQVGQDTLYTWQSAGVEVSKPSGRVAGGLVTLGTAVYADRNVFSSGDLLRSWRYRTAFYGSWLAGTLRGSSLHLKPRITLARKRRIFRADSTSSLTQVIVEFESEAVAALSRSLRLRAVPVVRMIESSEAVVPLSEQFYVGGARTLRGYRENQFHGRRVATMATELLVGPDRTQNAYLFVDVGYVHTRTQMATGAVIRRNSYPVGVGFGFRTRSSVGNIDLSFGVGDRLSLQQTKVHVLLEQRF